MTSVERTTELIKCAADITSGPYTNLIGYEVFAVHRFQYMPEYEGTGTYSRSPHNTILECRHNLHNLIIL